MAISNKLNWTATKNKENTPKETCSKTPVESLTWKKPCLILFQTTKSRARNVFLLGSFLNLWRSSCLGACRLVLLTLLNLLPQIRLTWILFDFPSALSLKKNWLLQYPLNYVVILCFSGPDYMTNQIKPLSLTKIVYKKRINLT